MLTQKRRNTLTVLTTIALIVIIFSSSVAPGVYAGYGRRKKIDSWGDIVMITANYNSAGGHVDFAAKAGRNGFKISSQGLGLTLGYYVARILKVRVYLKCYDSAGNVIKYYSRTYYMRKGTYTKAVSVPAGTARIYAKVSAKFQLLISPFPTRTLSTSLYA